MPLAPEAEALVDELLDLYRAAQADLIDELVRVAGDTSLRGRAYRSRLTGLSRAVTQAMEDLDAAAADWTTRSLPEVYALGAEQAAQEVGERFNWTQIHREAVQVLAQDTYSDLLAATRFVRRDTKAFIRTAAREHSRAVLLEGKTATQAGRELSRRLGQRGISAVTYKNGARHGLADYSDTVVRTKTALAYNGGQLNIAVEHDVPFVQVSDGAGCGWTSHDDPDTANGSVRTRDEANEYPIAHPRCARSFALLPVETREQAQAVASGDYTAAPSPPATSGGGGHQARLDARQAKLRR